MNIVNAMKAEAISHAIAINGPPVGPGIFGAKKQNEHDMHAFYSSCHCLWIEICLLKRVCCLKTNGTAKTFQSRTRYYFC